MNQPLKPVLLDLPMPITTKRLTIRPMTAGDGAMVNSGIRESQKELKVYMTWADPVPSVEESEERARKSYAAWILREDLTMVALDSKTGELVGCTGFHRMKWHVPMVEIGYWIRSSKTGKGYATEIAAGLTKYAIETLKARRIEIRCDVRNVASARAAEKAGFKLEARLHGDDLICQSQNLRDTFIYTYPLKP